MKDLAMQSPKHIDEKVAAAAAKAMSSSQRGATLFVALTILIILTILALSTAQVTGLQERMAGIYRADNQAFLSAESEVRALEGDLLNDNLLCANAPVNAIPSQWYTETPAARTSIENLSYQGVSSDSPGMSFGGSAEDNLLEAGGIGCLVFRISALQSDDPTGPTSRSIVQSVFVP